MSDDTNRITRRSVLQKSIASATAIGIGSTGAIASRASTSVRSGPDVDEAAFEAADSYLSESAIREALDTHASDALAEAAEEGVLEAADPDALTIDTLHDSPGSWVEASEGATVFAEELDGRPSPKIEVKTRLSDGRTFTVVVRPAESESQWTVREPTTTGQSAASASTSSVCGCWLDAGCTWICVGGTCEARLLYCCCDHTCDSGEKCSNPVNCDCQDVCGSTC
jgi:hypothetical protein